MTPQAASCEGSELTWDQLLMGTLRLTPQHIKHTPCFPCAALEVNDWVMDPLQCARVNTHNHTHTHTHTHNHTHRDRDTRPLGPAVNLDL